MIVSRCLPLLGALALASCDDSAPVTDDGFGLTTEGPFGAGYRKIATTYTLPDGRGERTIDVSIWYPIDRAEYDDPDVLCAEYHLLTGNSCGAVQGAPAVRPAYRRGYPVVVHSHGHLGWSSQSKWLGEHLARHGYVVVAPNHVGNTIDQNSGPDYLALKYERALDVSAALDLLESGLPSGDPLAGRTVTDEVVVTGHSRGTTTVWAVLGAQYSRAVFEAECAAGNYDTRGGCPSAVLAQFDQSFRDPRIVAGMPLAGSGGPGDYGGVSAFDAVTAPVMMMVGSADSAMAGVTSVADTTTRSLPWLEFTGACHNFFAHDPFDPNNASDPCSAGIDHPAGQAAFRTYLLAFTRRELFDDQSPEVTGILDGTSSVSSIVVYHP